MNGTSTPARNGCNSSRPPSAAASLFISVLALLVGLILAAISIRRIRRLELEAEKRFAEVEEARRELRKLSERLVNAQEDERRSLSRELHDEVGQSMSAMLVELGRLESIPSDHPDYRCRLARVRSMAEANVGTVRNMALLLRPSMLDDLGLVPALNRQAREVTRRTGLKVKMIAGEIAEDLPEADRTCVYRVVQEALNNCAKHSQAAQVRVVISQDSSGLSVSVQDDGIGFDPRRQKGMGVLGMEERVERLGGVLGLESQPGHGAISLHPAASAQPAAGRIGERWMIRIILADDHAVMRRGLRLLLEQQKDFHVVEGNSATAAKP